VSPAALKADEHSHQVAVIDWWAYACKGYGLPEFALYAVPNGGDRHPAVAAKLKAEGVRSGILDLNLDAQCPRVPEAMGLRIEMKVKPNRPSKAQQAVIDYLRRARYHVVVAWDAEEAIQAITGYLAPCPPSA
jgi:hypothetical protein